MSSFVSLLTAKSVDLVVARDGFLSYRGYFDNREKFLICTAMHNELNLADAKA